MSNEQAKATTPNPGVVNAPKVEEPKVSNPTSENKKEEPKKKKEKKPRLTATEKFLETTTEEERIAVAKKVAELRLDPKAERTMSWRNIREHEDVILTSDQFHKVIRVSDYYQDAILDRLSELIESGWIHKGSLTSLCGFEVPEDISEAMQKNIDSEKAKLKAAADAKKAMEKEAKAAKEAKAKEVEEAKAKESQEKESKGKQSPPTTKGKPGK